MLTPAAAETCPLFCGRALVSVLMVGLSHSGEQSGCCVFFSLLGGGIRDDFSRCRFYGTTEPLVPFVYFFCVLPPLLQAAGVFLTCFHGKELL